MRVLVTGGTGTLGRPAVEHLLDRGHEVRVLSRRSSPALPHGATGVQQSLCRSASRRIAGPTPKKPSEMGRARGPVRIFGQMRRL